MYVPDLIATGVQDFFINEARLPGPLFTVAITTSRWRPPAKDYALNNILSHQNKLKTRETVIIVFYFLHALFFYLLVSMSISLV